MCGITGFLNYQNSDRKNILATMNDAIAHRGPDGEGLFLDENIGLAHRRLAIIDLDTGGQPMFSVDKRYATVFNGEILHLNLSRFQVYQRIFILASTQIWFKKYKPELEIATRNSASLALNSNSVTKNRKKRILCVVGQLGNGGTEKQLYMFLKHLDKEKFSASVFVTGSDGGIWADRITGELGIDITFTGKVSLLAKIVSYRRELRSQKPDVVFSWSFFTNALVCASKSIPFVGSLRQQYSEAVTSFSLLRKWLSTLPKKIIVNSNYISEELLAIGFLQEKIPVVFNIFESENRCNASVDEKKAFRQKYNIPEDAVIIMGVGGNSTAKNFSFFVDVVVSAKKKAPEIHAVLVGAGGSALKEDILARGLSESFTITGEVPNAQNLLKSADIFFLSSLKEGMPNVLLEAIYAGCASIATDVGGVRDIFNKVPKDLLKKILIETNDVDIASDMLVNLVLDAELRTQVSGYTTKFLSELTPDTIMKQYYKILFPNL